MRSYFQELFMRWSRAIRMHRLVRREGRCSEPSLLSTNYDVMDLDILEFKGIQGNSREFKCIQFVVKIIEYLFLLRKIFWANYIFLSPFYFLSKLYLKTFNPRERYNYFFNLIYPLCSVRYISFSFFFSLKKLISHP